VANRVFRFPAYSGSPETTADWKIGSTNDNMEGAFGIAVDPTATYVAVAFEGSDFSSSIGGSTQVFAVSNGAPVVTLGPANHSHTDVAWDNVGNLYAADETDGTWRSYSPPGTNLATTVSVATVQVGGSSGGVRPVITSAYYSRGQFHLTVVGEANVIYTILASADLVNWVPVATNNSVFATRYVTVTASQQKQYFRVLVGAYSPAPPVLTSPAKTATQFGFKLICAPSVTYVIQATSDFKNWLPVSTNTASGATNQVAIPASASASAYRAVLPQ
jgi:hypothetical protein